MSEISTSAHGWLLQPAFVGMAAIRSTLDASTVWRWVSMVLTMIILAYLTASLNRKKTSEKWEHSWRPAQISGIWCWLNAGHYLMPSTIVDAGRVTADMAKLLDHLGRLQRSAFSLLTQLLTRYQPDRGCAAQGAVVPEFPGQLPPRAPRSSSTTRANSSRRRKVRGCVGLDLAAALPAPSHRSRANP